MKLGTLVIGLVSVVGGTSLAATTPSILQASLSDASLLKVPAIIDDVANTVVFGVFPGTDRSNLRPLFNLSVGATARPQPGAALDLSHAQVYRLHSEGTKVVDWKVMAIKMRSPSLPGYYADPNIAVFGDNYYIYPTSDGYPGWGGQEFYVWKSPDLVQWTRSDKPILTLNGTDGNVPWATGNAESSGFIELINPIADCTILETSMRCSRRG